MSQDRATTNLYPIKTHFKQGAIAWANGLAKNKLSQIICTSVGAYNCHWCQLQLKAFSNLVSSLEAGNVALGGSAASKGGGASRTAFPVGDWEQEKSCSLPFTRRGLGWGNEDSHGK
ncbi:hypothetical protein [Nostoc sp. DSM 114159]